MATEADTYMATFYAANEREKIKNENRAVFGDRYVGGTAGAIADISSAVAGGSSLMSFAEAGANVLDTRPFEVKVDEQLKKYKDMYGGEFVQQLEKRLEKTMLSALYLPSEDYRRYGLFSDEVTL
tara:strand:+ start:5792 stop:6166 length:375 start_codon:yes stop_codon:yes gene_type:complete